MRFPKGYAGVKKLFASEILNIISTLLFFVTSIITIIFSKKISNPNYLPFVVIPMMAVGGITEKNAAEYIAAGAIGVGVGGNLANKTWIDAGEYYKITETAAAMVAAVK